MAQKYTHLSAEERTMIEIEIGNGASLRSVARCLGRNVSSVSRELNGRPRQTLGWLTPEEMTAKEMAEFAKRVALDS